jgi:hypothetical protein
VEYVEGVARRRKDSVCVGYNCAGKHGGCYSNGFNGYGCVGNVWDCERRGILGRSCSRRGSVEGVVYVARGDTVCQENSWKILTCI